jgi:hypothetical protein
VHPDGTNHAHLGPVSETALMADAELQQEIARIAREMTDETIEAVTRRTGQPDIPEDLVDFMKSVRDLGIEPRIANIGGLTVIGLG